MENKRPPHLGRSRTKKSRDEYVNSWSVYRFVIARVERSVRCAVMMVVMSMGNSVSREAGCEEAKKADVVAITTFRFGVERSMVLPKNAVLTSGANLKGDGSCSVYPALRKSQAAAMISSLKRRFGMLKTLEKRSTAVSGTNLPGIVFQY